MDLNFSAFQEPRGVMRVLHLVFSICAFATITGYSGSINMSCGKSAPTVFPFDYPFEITQSKEIFTQCTANISVDYHSDAQFFVATGVLAMLYSIAAIVIYAKFDETYKTNTQWPLFDFIGTVVFGVLWLSSSAAWANSLSSLKYSTSDLFIGDGCKDCGVTTSSFSTLNISVVFGFLNFFLWAADLWFLYKETAWFQGSQQQQAQSDN